MGYLESFGLGPSYGLYVSGSALDSYSSAPESAVVTPYRSLRTLALTRGNTEGGKHVWDMVGMLILIPVPGK